MSATAVEFTAGLAMIKQEARGVTEGLVAVVSAERTKPAALLSAFRALAELPSRDGVRACLKHLQLEVPVAGIRQPDDQEWAWPARKALLTMGWIAVPTIVSWVREGDRGEADLKAIAWTLVDICGVGTGLSIVRAEAGRTSGIETPERERLARVLPVLEEAMKSRPALPWR